MPPEGPRGRPVGLGGGGGRLRPPEGEARGGEEEGYMYTYICMYVCIYIYIYVHIYVTCILCVDLHDIYIYIYTYVCVYIYTYIYTHCNVSYYTVM